MLLPVQFAFNTLSRVSPVSHGVCNVVKRVAIIVTSVLFFGTPLSNKTKIGAPTPRPQAPLPHRPNAYPRVHILLALCQALAQQNVLGNKVLAACWIMALAAHCRYRCSSAGNIPIHGVYQALQERAPCSASSRHRGQRPDHQNCLRASLQRGRSGIAVAIICYTGGEPSKVEGAQAQRPFVT